MFMNMLNEIRKYKIKYPLWFITKGLLGKCLPDKVFLKLRYYVIFGTKLNFNQPQSFNEKLQWLKLNDRNPIYHNLVDKYESKKIIAGYIGSKYIVKTLGCWSDFNKIDFDRLPSQFVLKTTHDSGSYIICKDKTVLDIKIAKNKLSNSLKRNFFWPTREWPYKNISPRIIAEEYIADSHGELTDYKFYCFNGYVDCVMACYERETGEPKFYFFDKEWNLKRINLRGRAAPADFTKQKPVCLNEMFSIAGKLSEGIPFVRVDLYEVDGKVYFGEMTFYPDSGLDPNYLPETDKYFGNLIDLSLAYKNKK